ncbi:MAG: DUF2917 domain-containing protein [Luteolibacter sp.]|uniref:DUF2917 domain-containing protein n=1 Tax=Luteolibacter sp. TaxID=1962973 RepID=UPI003267138E
MQTILPITPLSRWLTGYRSQQIRPTPSRIEELPARKVLTASFPNCGKITCTHGTLWITRDGSSEDILLRAGGSFACETGSRFVIEALENAVVEITGSSGVGFTFL